MRILFIFTITSLFISFSSCLDENSDPTIDPGPEFELGDILFEDACNDISKWDYYDGTHFVSESGRLRLESDGWSLAVPKDPSFFDWDNYVFEGDYEISNLIPITELNIISVHGKLNKHGPGNTMLDFEGWNIEYRLSDLIGIMYYLGDGTETNISEALPLDTNTPPPVPPTGHFILICIEREVRFYINDILYVRQKMPEPYAIKGSIGLGSFDTGEGAIFFDNIKVTEIIVKY